jgi:vacuolar-type H+-ATPase subunit H
MSQLNTNKSFLKYIEQLEDLVLNGAGIPLTPLTMVNSEQLVSLLDEIRDNLPEEIQQARKTLEMRDKMLQEASEQSAFLMESAQQQARQILSESELMKAVYREAEGIRQQILAETNQLRQSLVQEAESVRVQASRDAALLRHDAESYVTSVLQSLDRTFHQYHEILNTTQMQLSTILPQLTSTPTNGNNNGAGHDGVSHEGGSAVLSPLGEYHPSASGGYGATNGNNGALAANTHSGLQWTSYNGHGNYLDQIAVSQQHFGSNNNGLADYGPPPSPPAANGQGGYGHYAPHAGYGNGNGNGSGGAHVPSHPHDATPLQTVAKAMIQTPSNPSKAVEQFLQEHHQKQAQAQKQVALDSIRSKDRVALPLTGGSNGYYGATNGSSPSSNNGKH